MTSIYAIFGLDVKHVDPIRDVCVWIRFDLDDHHQYHVTSLFSKASGFCCFPCIVLIVGCASVRTQFQSYIIQIGHNNKNSGHNN